MKFSIGEPKNVSSSGQLSSSFTQSSSVALSSSSKKNLSSSSSVKIMSSSVIKVSSKVNNSSSSAVIVGVLGEQKSTGQLIGIWNKHYIQVETAGFYKYEIFNPMGKLVQTGVGQGRGLVELSNSLESGTWIVRIHESNRIKQWKVQI